MISFEIEEDVYDEDDVEYKHPHTVTTAYNYQMAWKGDDNEHNSNQHSRISQCGHLYIVVAKDKEFGDFFDDEDINDEGATHFRMGKYDIEDWDNDNDGEPLE